MLVFRIFKDKVVIRLSKSLGRKSLNEIKQQ